MALSLSFFLPAEEAILSFLPFFQEEVERVLVGVDLHPGLDEGPGGHPHPGDLASHECAVMDLAGPAGGGAFLEDRQVDPEEAAKADRLLRGRVVFLRQVLPFLADHLPPEDLRGGARHGKPRLHLGAEGHEVVLLLNLPEDGEVPSLPVVAAAVAQEAGAYENLVHRGDFRTKGGHPPPERASLGKKALKGRAPRPSPWSGPSRGPCF